MKKLLVLLLLLPSIAWAQKPPINAVAGPTTSAQVFGIITDPSGTGPLTFGGATVTGVLTPGNIAQLTSGGITDSGFQLVTSLPAGGLVMNPTNATGIPQVVTALLMANNSCSTPTYSFFGSPTTGIASLGTGTAEVCVGGNRLLHFTTATGSSFIQFGANSTPSISVQGTASELQLRGLTNNGVALMADANYVLRTFGVASAVNFAKLTNSISGNGPIMTTDGTDTDVPYTINTKGAGALTLAPAKILLSGITVTPTGNQPLCIDTSTKQIYFGTGGGC